MKRNCQPAQATPTSQGTRWADVPGYAGRYAISSQGEIRRQDGSVNRGWKNDNGYMRCDLYIDGHREVRYVHELVLLAFVGPRPGYDYHACHNDGNRKNNRLDNLRWDTVEANANDKVRHSNEQWEALGQQAIVTREAVGATL